MLFEAWYYQLLGLLPQCIALVALGTALVREKFSIWKIIAAGIISGLLLFAVLQLPVKYGAHIPIGIIIFIIVLQLYLKINIIKSAIASMLSFIMLTVIELIVILISINVFRISESIFEEGPDRLRFLYALPSLVVLILIAIAAQFILRHKGVRKDNRIVG